MNERLFDVYLYFHGCINERIMAENKQQAIERLRKEVDSLNPADFNERAGIIEEDSDIFEL